MTAQIGDRLRVDGKAVQMMFCPPLPPDDTLLIPTTVRHCERQEPNGDTHYYCEEEWIDRDGVRRREEGCTMTYSTACWRGYVASWEIKDGHFYLVGLTGRLRLACEGPLLADWFTGVLRIPQGKLIHYVHMGFGSVYEEELHIFVERGVVSGRRVLDNRGEEHDTTRLGWLNLPGFENRFRGDKDFH